MEADPMVCSRKAFIVFSLYCTDILRDDAYNWFARLRKIPSVSHSIPNSWINNFGFQIVEWTSSMEFKFWLLQFRLRINKPAIHLRAKNRELFDLIKLFRKHYKAENKEKLTGEQNIHTINCRHNQWETTTAKHSCSWIWLKPSHCVLNMTFWITNPDSQQNESHVLAEISHRLLKCHLPVYSNASSSSSGRGWAAADASSASCLQEAK